MSFDIWPPIPPAELRLQAAQAQERELAWIMGRTLDACRELKHGLEECHALLAPVDPGSTLVMSTPRNEKVKGTITRVGTRITKGTLSLQLRLMPPQTLGVCDIRIRPLDDLLTRLAESIDLLSLILSPSRRLDSPQSLSSALRLIADAITSSASLLKGASNPSAGWTVDSVPMGHLAPSPGPNFSFHVAIRECSVVVCLRVLEPVDAKVHFGTKLGLAIGTVRRLEHDEMDMVFRYKPGTDASARAIPSSSSLSSSSSTSAGSSAASAAGKGFESVYVREKVRLESADPSLISLQAKLAYLGVMLGQARRNLAAVMGVKLETW